MNRREFFRRASLIAAGVVAADQLELLERLAHSKIWAGHTFDQFPFKEYKLGFLITQEMIDDDSGIYPGKIYYPSTRIKKISYVSSRS